MDHTEVLRCLVEEGVLKLKDTNSEELCREEAWVILTTLWHERLKRNETIGSADPKVADLVDLVHSIGTTRMAAITAAVLAFLVAASFSQFQSTAWPIFRFIIAVGFAGAVFYILHVNYSRTAGFAQGVIDQVLYDALVAEANKSDTAVVVTWPMLRRNRDDTPIDAHD
jgi:hypothetical protein